MSLGVARLNGSTAKVPGVMAAATEAKVARERNARRVIECMPDVEHEEQGIAVENFVLCDPSLAFGDSVSPECRHCQK
jgi:hypothetical protein